MIANIITVSRILFSFALLVFSPSSALFGALYLLCGATDILDGFLARRLHTESKTGALLDSIADLVFAAAYAVKLLPILDLPAWIWIWIAVIGAVKIFGILRRRRKEKEICIEHSAANKLTGLLIFLFPLTVYLIDIRYSAIAVCAAATFTAAEEVFGREKKRDSENKQKEMGIK